MLLILPAAERPAREHFNPVTRRRLLWPAAPVHEGDDRTNPPSVRHPPGAFTSTTGSSLFVVRTLQETRAVEHLVRKTLAASSCALDVFGGLQVAELPGARIRLYLPGKAPVDIAIP